MVFLRQVLESMPFCAGWLLALVISQPCWAESPSVDWHRGAQLHRQLDSTVALSWTDNPLRAGLLNLARTQHVAIFLDRRIDPDQRPALNVEAPLEQALRELAGAIRQAVSILDPLVYLGPPEVAKRLATLAAIKRDEVRRLPAARRAQWQRQEAWQWERLTTPRELLDRLAKQTQCQILNAERVPHDLWPAVELPKMPAADRWSLVLANFSLTFEFTNEGSALQLVDIPESVVLERMYSPRRQLAAVLAQLPNAFPQLEASRSGQRLRARGTYEDHVALRRWLRGETEPPKRGPPGVKTHSLTVAATPAAAVINKLCQQLGLTVKLTPGVRERLQQPVSLRVENVPLEVLLQKTLDPVGVRFRVVGQTLELE